MSARRSGGLSLEGAPCLEIESGDLPCRPTGVVERLAVRAVIRCGEELLMIRSGLGGDLKFPGGGLEAGEALADALVREVREECGREVLAIGGVLLVVDERRPALDPGCVLRMESVYVACEVGAVEHELALDGYERELRFGPEWVSQGEAIEANRRALEAAELAPWVRRELRVLEWLEAGAHP